MALIQHWKLDDNAASTTIVATVGNNGALLGGDNTEDKTVAGPGGIVTAGMQFNGIDDAIDISGAAISITTTNPVSISLWFKKGIETSGGGGMIGISTNSSNDSINSLTDTSVRVNVSANVTFTVPSMGTTLWHHLLFTKDASDDGRLFIDGVESASGTQDMGTGAFAPNRLGGNFSTTYHNIALAQVKVFNTDESANVAALYAEGVSSSPRRIFLIQ